MLIDIWKERLTEMTRHIFVICCGQFLYILCRTLIIFHFLLLEAAWVAHSGSDGEIGPTIHGALFSVDRKVGYSLNIHTFVKVCTSNIKKHALDFVSRHFRIIIPNPASHLATDEKLHTDEGHWIQLGFWRYAQTSQCTIFTLIAQLLKVVSKES